MLIFIITLLFLQSLPADESLHVIFQTIERETGYKFLYRDALVAGKDADFSMSDDWQESLVDLLEDTGLAASMDHERKRVVIYAKSEPDSTETEIIGYVIDRDSGERLPFATVSWTSRNNTKRSSQTDSNGRFVIPSVSNRSNLSIHVSYVGYRQTSLEFNRDSLPVNSPLNIRLEPSLVEISEIFVTGSFYYDVAPARYHAPPGGVLNLVTQTGSLHEYGGSFGLSNAVVKGSIDGPIQKGRSSWMFAGRHSILNSINLFDTAGMVSWGLDIDRETSLPDDAMDLNERIVDPGSYSVQFYDLHGKLFFEQNDNSSFTVSGYLGGDNTSQESERIIRAASNASRRFDRADFKTDNSWGNRSANVTYLKSLSGNRILQFQGGFSYLYTGYLKEDFIYQRPGQDPNRPPLFVSDFENESELNHGYLNAELEADRYTVGAVVNIYDAAYRELSLNRSEFFQRTRPVMPEAYGEYRLGSEQVNYSVNAGVRLQHYSDGDFTRLSPRIRAALFQNSPVSFGFSAGRNYQYLYRLSFYNQTTSDIWIMALDEQPPARSDQLSASVSVKPWQNAFIQIEGYLKQQQNLRIHEINFQNLETSFGGNPWFVDNEGYSRGAEFMFRQSFGKADITQSYTYSITELKNERFRNGEWFYAEWDRRHRFNTIVSYQMSRGLKASVNWIYSTGRPDRIRLSEDTQDRLGPYSRLDVSVGYSASIGETNIRIQGGFYNLTNRNNPWYREWVQTIDNSGIRPQLTPEQVDVYDLGIQPSVSVGFYF